MKDTVVVITGASRGLGKALAYACAAQGARVVVSAPNTPQNKEAIDVIADEIDGFVVMADVTKESDMQKLAEATIKHFSKIDIWINNAGIWLPRNSIEKIDMKRAHDVFEVNVFGTLYGCRSALAVMKKQGYGTIVNIVSTSALTGRAFFSVYSSSKHAAKGFTDSLREELKEQGSPVKVIGIYPGGIKTNLFDEKKPDDFDDYMNVETVTQKIIDNLLQQNPEEELVIKRPGQKI